MAVNAAVFGFVQAVVTAVATVLVGLVISGDLELAGRGENIAVAGQKYAFGVSVLVVQTVGVVLLFWGGVQVLGGRSRVLLVLGCLLAFVASLMWIVRMTGLPDASLEVFEGSLGLGIATAIALSVMPMLSLVFAMNGRITQFLASRRHERQGVRVSYR